MRPARAALAILASLLMIVPTTVAHLGGDANSGGEWVPRAPSKELDLPRGEVICGGVDPAWRDAQVVEGVEVRESRQCKPDDPRLVAAFVKGTNHMPQQTLDDLALHEDAVVKGPDLDGDGDPDVIDITLEIAELNGWHLSDDTLTEPFLIAPGIDPSFWVFTPKTTIHHSGDRFFNLVRMPTPVIRAEVGDYVNITVENSHYFPHTVHLHGIDHAFLSPIDEDWPDANGNDGVPIVSEHPIEPARERTYSFQARQAGTMFYHCHVQPDVHVLMGLNGLFVIEENRENNTLQTLNVGAGDVRHPSKASQEKYDREYDLHYQDIDKELHELPKMSNDPRVVAKAMHREYKTQERDPDYFLLNGKSFPYTLRESTIVVQPDEEVLLRVLNGGTHPVSLHTHGHKVTIASYDGVPVSEEAQVTRDVVFVSAAQRADLILNTTNDGLHNYGPGVWFMHDHQEEATTTDGINPGGDITVIAYEQFLHNDTSFPMVHDEETLQVLFTEEYYRGELPVFFPTGLDFLMDVEETESGGGAPGLAGLAALGVLAAAAFVVRWRRRA